MLTHIQRGFSAIKAGNRQEALQWFEKAWQENPADAQARAWLGQLLCSLGRQDEGAGHLLGAGRSYLDGVVEAKSLNLILEIAGQLQHWSDFVSAQKLLAATVEKYPGDFRACQMLAVTYAQLNKKAEALAAAGRAIILAPENWMMQVFLASLEADAGKNESARDRLEQVLAGQSGARERFRAHKELARVLDRLGEYVQVFPHLKASSELWPALPEYAQQDANLIPNMLHVNQAEFERGLMGRWAATAFPAELPAPVFVLGFMRSGTTLTQEVLDAHPGVFVADEIDFISALQRELHAMDQSGDSAAAKLRRLDLTGLLHLREFYWNRVRQRFGNAIDNKMFIDKFTMNTVDLGLINCVFPDAKIIFVTRDPRDVCLSCFMQLMVPTPATVNLLTWEETAKFYAQVMSWWLYIKDQMTLQYIELRYEDIVADFEGAFRQVFKLLELSWDPAVMDFHKRAAQKFVASPSRTQVSQPLYSSSVARWRRFEAEFTPVLATLRPFIEKFGYAEEVSSPR